MIKKLKGFTLIEFLIVIAITAILAAMLLPALARAKAQSQNGIRLHNGDKVEIVGLGVKGVIDRMSYDEATLLVVGNDGFPVKLEHVKCNILRKY